MYLSSVILFLFIYRAEIVFHAMRSVCEELADGVRR